eukprot:GSA25T00020259001.1
MSDDVGAGGSIGGVGQKGMKMRPSAERRGASSIAGSAANSAGTAANTTVDAPIEAARRSGDESMLETLLRGYEKENEKLVNENRELRKNAKELTGENQRLNIDAEKQRDEIAQLKVAAELNYAALQEKGPLRSNFVTPLGSPASPGYSAGGLAESGEYPNNKSVVDAGSAGRSPLGAEGAAET